jgi:hypothetical protein
LEVVQKQRPDCLSDLAHEPGSTIVTLSHHLLGDRATLCIRSAA